MNRRWRGYAANADDECRVSEAGAVVVYSDLGEAISSLRKGDTLVAVLNLTKSKLHEIRRRGCALRVLES